MRWNYTLSASNAATFAQLYLRPRDMLKLGVLFQQRGRWQGRQIVSREWVERSTARWSTVGDQDYGYFWWHQWADVALPGGQPSRGHDRRHRQRRAENLSRPSLDLVVVMTGGNYNAQSPAMAIMAKELLPAMLNGNTVPN